MSWYIRVVTPPYDEPLSLAEVKAQCRVDFDDDDDLLSAYITAARESVEADTGRALITQTLELGLDDFPRYEDRIRIPRGNLQSITSFTYYDTGQNAHTLTSPTGYILNQYAEPAEIVLPWSQVWPSIVLSTAAPVRIQFVAGWATPEAVPVTLKHAMSMLIADWYATREDTTIGRGIVSIETENGVDRLINSWCLRNYTPYSR